MTMSGPHVLHGLTGAMAGHSCIVAMRRKYLFMNLRNCSARLSGTNVRYVYFVFRTALDFDRDHKRCCEGEGEDADEDEEAAPKGAE